MKTLTLKTLLLMLLVIVSSRSVGQILLMKGKIRNSNDESMQGYYELRNTHKQLDMGRSNKLKLRLERNEVYTLTFSKPGYQSKTLIISTYADSLWWHLFQFDVVLHKMSVTEEMPSEIVAGRIFYDPALLTYNYTLGNTEEEVSAKASPKKTGQLKTN